MSRTKKWNTGDGLPDLPPVRAAAQRLIPERETYRAPM